ncbi:MAG: protease HtpX [Gammaproteobacteria bacterium]
MRRIFLFIVTNIAVLVVISVIFNVLGLEPTLNAQGINYESLLIFSAVIGFSGAFISLLLSKFTAKWMTGAKVVVNPTDPYLSRMLSTVAKLSERAGISTPEVAVYKGQPNAFATGAFRNSALIGVSTGLMEAMNEQQVEAVLAHEVAHIANGDMVTMTLLQGVLNTFVIFLSRIAAYVVTTALNKGEGNSGNSFVYFGVAIVFQIVFGVLASIIISWYSRRREFYADAGAARLMGTEKPMIGALQALARGPAAPLPQAMQAFGIKGGFGRLFSTHPPVEQRIAALEQRTFQAVL